MDFAFTADERAFAEEVRRFLREHPPRALRRSTAWTRATAPARTRARSCAALGARAGSAWAGRRAFGGQERPLFFKLVLLEELALAGAPFGPLAGCWQTADAIIDYGSERLRREVLPAVARGDGTFWQGYSEPGAGSDLLGLKTQARRDGDALRDPRPQDLVEPRRHRELRPRVRAHQPGSAPQPRLQHVRGAQRHAGMDIRPIRSLTGEVYHYEVFLDDVRVPADMRLGPEGEGFVALLNGLDSDRFWGRFYKAPASSACCASWSSTPTPRSCAGCRWRATPGIRRRLAAWPWSGGAARALLPRRLSAARRAPASPTRPRSPR